MPSDVDVDYQDPRKVIQDPIMAGITWNPQTGQWEYKNQGAKPGGGGLPVSVPKSTGWLGKIGSGLSSVGHFLGFGGKGGGSGSGVDTILKLIGAYNSTKGTSFKKAPEDPSMVALREKLLAYIENSPTRNMLGSMLGPRLEAANKTQFQLPQGANGYNPYPNGTPKPQYDMASILGSIATPQNPSAGSNPSGINSPLPPPPPVGDKEWADWSRRYAFVFNGAPPRTIEQYRNWYQQKYGRPY